MIRSRLIRFGILALLASGMLVSNTASADIYLGQPLHEALLDLNARGTSLVFSNNLVTDDMRVETAPSATDTVEIARQILAPHSLSLVAGPADKWIVSRAEQQPAEPPPTADAVDDAGEETIAELIVLANRYVLFGEDTNAVMSHEDIERMPHLADDVMRAVQRLPVIASDDLSARFHVRGGTRDEAALRLDGLELIDPYHLKDLTGIFSIIDSNLVDKVEVLPGGFPANYGDYASGVVNIESLSSPDETALSIGVSFVNSFINTRGSFNDQQGGWILSLRRGYLDLLADDQGSEVFSPKYLDGFAKIEHQLGDRHMASLHLLSATEDLDITDIDVNDAGEAFELSGKSDSRYVWARIESNWNERLTSENVIWQVKSDRSRDINHIDPRGTSSILFDDRRVKTAGLRSGWQIMLDNSWVISFGAEVKDQRVDYDYSLNSVTNSILFPFAPDIDRRTLKTVEGESYGAYVSVRKTVGKLDAELGWRWDAEQYTGLDEDLLSPRLALTYRLNDKTRLSASWGDYNQFHKVELLQVEDGIEEFFPATRTKHLLVGFEHQLSRSLQLRGDVYQKTYQKIRPRFTNLFDGIELIPEANPDRIQVNASEAEAHGLELVLKYSSESEFSWWASYVYSRTFDTVDGKEVAREWDQRHAADFVGNWRGKKWNFNVAARWHSGWPRTDASLGLIDTPGGSQPVLIPGERNANNFDDYSRVDVRVSRDVELKRGDFKYYFEIYNLFDSRNVCCVDEIYLDDSNSLAFDEEDWGGTFPSLGFVWTFY